MIKGDFWDLTNRPYTQLKLSILDKYLRAWATLFFSKASKNKSWKTWQKLYYIDCFAGRGKYHKDGKSNVIDGSPLIALKCAEDFQNNPRYQGVTMDCFFIEKEPKSSKELEILCNPYKGKVNFKIYNQKDFNEVIPEILAQVQYHPCFFFIDPDGIKELQKESLKKIVDRKGPTDILLNYIKGGVERICGLAKKRTQAILDKDISEKDVKTIKRLTDFYGLSIFENLNKSERERLKEWTFSLLEGSELSEIAVFDMPYLHKSDAIYYLLFASRKLVAKEIIVQIFKDAKKETYCGQKRLNISSGKDFEL